MSMRILVMVGRCFQTLSYVKLFHVKRFSMSRCYVQRKVNGRRRHRFQKDAFCLSTREQNGGVVRLSLWNPFSKSIVFGHPKRRLGRASKLFFAQGLRIPKTAPADPEKKLNCCKHRLRCHMWPDDGMQL